MNEQIKELIKNLREQDNRITFNPIFVVQVKNRIYGMDSGYNSQGYIWVRNDDWVDIDDDELIEKLDDIEDHSWEYSSDSEEVKLLGEYTKVYYQDLWENKMPFFTEKAAEQYIRINGHNMKEPRIYVESGYRNAEWELIREYFLNLDKKEGE